MKLLFELDERYGNWPQFEDFGWSREEYDLELEITRKSYERFKRIETMYFAMLEYYTRRAEEIT